jgi:hypothetical protein
MVGGMSGIESTITSGAQHLPASTEPAQEQEGRDGQ